MVDPIPAGSRLLAEDLGDWEDAINAALTGWTKHKPGSTSRSNANTGATYTDDPDLTGPVVANGIYTVELKANCTVGAGNFKQRFTFPSGTLENIDWSYNNGTVTFTSSWFRATAGSSPGGTVAGVTAGATSGFPWRMTATLYVGVTGGTLAWQWAQDSANAANTTVAKGAWLRAIRIG